MPFWLHRCRQWRPPHAEAGGGYAFAKLPQVLLEELLGYLSAPSLYALGSTCRALNRVATEEAAWLAFNLDDRAAYRKWYDSAYSLGDFSQPVEAPECGSSFMILVPRKVGFGETYGGVSPRAKNTGG
jgi:hypothetical protein